MSEALTADQQMRVKAMEFCIALYSTLHDADIEDFEGMANDIYEFIKGETE
jgi:hypothetical protein